MRRSLVLLLVLVLAPGVIVYAQPIASNIIQLISKPSGTAPQVASSGIDANIDINLVPKGTGCVRIKGGACLGTGPSSTATFLTWTNQAVSLPNSRNLVAGTNVTFDDTVANVRTVNAAGAAGATGATGATGPSGTLCPLVSVAGRILVDNGAGGCDEFADFTWDDTLGSLIASNSPTLTGANLQHSGLVMGTLHTLDSTVSLINDSGIVLGNSGTLDASAIGGSSIESSGIFAGFGNSIIGGLGGVGQSVILGGDGGTIQATVNGNQNNSGIIGGQQSTITGAIGSVIAGGQFNSISELELQEGNHFIGGGSSNLINNTGSAAIIGGDLNTISAAAGNSSAVTGSFIGGGLSNSILATVTGDGQHGVILGGQSATLTDAPDSASIGGNGNALTGGGAGTGPLFAIGSNLTITEPTGIGLLLGFNMDWSTGVPGNLAVGIGVSAAPEIVVTAAQIALPGAIASGSATGRRVLCIDNVTKVIYISANGTDCSN